MKINELKKSVAIRISEHYQIWASVVGGITNRVDDVVEIGVRDYVRDELNDN